MRKELTREKRNAIREAMIDLGYWGDAEDVDAELARRAKENNTITIDDPSPTNEDTEDDDDDDRELFTGSRTWAAHFWGFWLHAITWKMIFAFTFTLTVAHVGAATIWRVERASLYETAGNVRLDYQEKLGCHLGYCLWVKRHDLSVDAPSLADHVESMKADERKRYGFTREYQQEWHLPAKLPKVKTPPAPDVLSELGMKGPSGH